jgi:hypothetical protein
MIRNNHDFRFARNPPGIDANRRSLARPTPRYKIGCDFSISFM